MPKGPRKETEMADVTRGEINDIIAGFASKSVEYRDTLLADPKKVLAKQMNQELPDWLNVKVVEETADTIYLVLPHVPKEGDELSDADLEMVAGGKDEDKDNTYTCNDAIGVATRVEINMSAV
jgi:hypothetical protein